ncbi:MAG: DUF2753 family protein [Pelatocladus maniniholoensis HA4357-MV3]|jgi:tetratricopeptide (TPR) repeat protein|uniref:DUF2753 family protein n=1 Tax=Pelatocladus maniniholoensis HA4357-MV3 TaxID=1117104 RepID=A0A9E3HDF4_9NOST|nr:DUF2753 family protein [Pelatocladus maniniholoensis HA4357-MV3]
MEGDHNCYESRELNWQLYTKTGNQRMQAKLYQEAQQAYQQAVDLANSLLSQAKHTATNPDTIHLYVVSCHNLADCFLAMGDAGQAEAILQQAYTEIIDTMNQSSFSMELRFEALKALKMVSCEMHISLSSTKPNSVRKQGDARCDRVRKSISGAISNSADLSLALHKNK